MTYDEVMKLSPEELCIKCAEIERKQSLRGKYPKVCRHRKQYCWADGSGGVSRLINYDDPRDYMRLAGKIWEKEYSFTIHQNYLRWVNRKEKHPSDRFIDFDKLGKAIQRAFVIICGEEK